MKIIQVVLIFSGILAVMSSFQDNWEGEWMPVNNDFSSSAVDTVGDLIRKKDYKCSDYEPLITGAFIKEVIPELDQVPNECALNCNATEFKNKKTEFKNYVLYATAGNTNLLRSKLFIFSLAQNKWAFLNCQ